MSGFLGDLSAEQEAALKEFKERCQDLLVKPEHDDRYCLRWLRARAFNVKKAEEMLRKHFVWRAENNVDTLLENFTIHPVVDKYLSRGLLRGADKDGRPVIAQKLGELDLKGLLKSASPQDILLAHIHSLELILRGIREAKPTKEGTVIESATVIADVGGLGTRHLWRPGLKLFVEMMATMQDNYPETLERVIIIRAPRIFPTIYNMIKGVFDARTRSKFEIVSGDWQKRLQDFIPASTLPEEYGGTAPDWGDVCQGGMVDKKYYKSADDSFDQHVIGAGKAHLVEFRVEHPNSVIAWDYFTEEHDIGFGVFFTTDEDAVKVKEMEEVVKTERTPCAGQNVEGSYIAERCGRYLLRWDNTYSMMRSKTVFYKAECVLPDEKVVEEAPSGAESAAEAGADS